MSTTSTSPSLAVRTSTSPNTSSHNNDLALKAATTTTQLASPGTPPHTLRNAPTEPLPSKCAMQDPLETEPKEAPLCSTSIRRTINFTQPPAQERQSSPETTEPNTVGGQQAPNDSDSFLRRCMPPPLHTQKNSRQFFIVTAFPRETIWLENDNGRSSVGFTPRSGRRDAWCFPEPVRQPRPALHLWRLPRPPTPAGWGCGNVGLFFRSHY